MTPENVASLKGRFPALWSDVLAGVSDSRFLAVEALLISLAGNAPTETPCAECGESAVALMKYPGLWNDRWLCARHIIETQAAGWKGQEP
ncbi:hypothetical protein ACC684_28430 [Rhizobium ruizarguesonis]